MSDDGYDIIVFALARWHGQYSSSAYSLARELSRHSRVFYIDNPFTWKDFFLGRSDPQIARRVPALRGGVDPFMVPDPGYPGLVTVTPELVFPVNWMPAGMAYDLVSEINDRIVSRVFRKLFAEFRIERYVLINAFNPLYGRFFRWPVPPALTIYYCVDDIRNSAYVSRHGSYLETDAVRKADITLVTSLELMKLKSATARYLHYFPNAADVDLFQTAAEENGERPPELRDISPDRKIIFYMGNICHRIDYELLRKIAARKEWYLIMTGPTTSDQYRDAGLDKMSNVVFTGKKDLKDLPSYLRFADCCIIPFLLIPLTRSIYPLKINEYLSAGKPVVTTDFSEDIRNFGAVVNVSKSHDEFVSNIVLAMQTDSPEKRTQRMAYSANNSWKARGAELINLISVKMSGHDD